MPDDSPEFPIPGNNSYVLHGLVVYFRTVVKGDVFVHLSETH